MQIRIWQAFSCNNSSAYRLVARFGDPAVAAKAAAALTRFFEQHAREADDVIDALTASDDYEPSNAPSRVCVNFAKKNGFVWTSPPMWSDGDLEGDKPGALAAEGTVVVYHAYRSTLPEELTTYLRKRGATTIEPLTNAAATVSVLFRLPGDGAGKKLEAELVTLFGQASEHERIHQWTTKPPWTFGADQRDDASTNTAFFTDGKTVGFYIAIDPDQIVRLRRHLGASGVEGLSLRMCEPNDLVRFKAIASARCDGCDLPLEYIDPRSHRIDVEQLACNKCGGMFDLAAFLPNGRRRRRGAT